MKNNRSLIALVILILPLATSLLLPSIADAASITLDRPSGAVGTTVVVSGTDFAGQLATIYFDDKKVMSDIPVSASGDFSQAITVPSGANGEHTIRVTDSSNWSGSAATIKFTIVPGISIFPNSGKYLSRININGNGFPIYETDIKITWDNTILNISPIVADKQGKWYYDFEIPNAVAKGEHFLGAFSKTIPADQITKMPVIVVPWAKITPTSGPVGTKINVNAWGFRVGEDGITLTYDDQIMIYNINANAEGSVINDQDKRIGDTTEKPIFVVPPSAQGVHKVGIFGSSFTPRGIFADMDFVVTPSIEIDPKTGKEGTQATIKGFGFAQNDSVTLSFDTTVLKQTGVADATGSFSVVFDIPQSATKDHTITAISSKGQSAKTTFTSEKTVSREVKLVSPAEKAEFTFFNSAWEVFVGTAKYLFGVFDYLNGTQRTGYESASIVFDWSDIGLQEISYVIEIASTSNPSMPVLTKEVKGKSEYSLSGNDSLPTGTYTWKVKSRYDGADGQWSESRTFNITAMSGRVWLFSVAITVLALAAIIFIVLLIRANMRRY
ncbi:MAG TPA: hypothetical protein DCX22_01720 [Dehalococcoidia bacterium]|nr:hypothetical protein [Dehalococcoidia bacterium]